MWFVNSGPTPNHLQDCKCFYTKKHAISYIATLEEKPTGGERPYEIIKRDIIDGDAIDLIIKTNI